MIFSTIFLLVLVGAIGIGVVLWFQEQEEEHEEEEVMHNHLQKEHEALEAELAEEKRSGHNT